MTSLKQNSSSKNIPTSPFLGFPHSSTNSWCCAPTLTSGEEGMGSAFPVHL